MPALEPFFQLMGIAPKKLSKEELILIEADLFVRICEKLKEHFFEKYSKLYFDFNTLIEMEDYMVESSLVRIILEDLLSTKDYTPAGIAYYTNIHEDVINDLSSGLNKRPLATSFRKIVELHRTVRPSLYYTIIKKIIREYREIDL